MYDTLNYLPVVDFLLWFSYARVSVSLNNANTISLTTLQCERISGAINQFDVIK